jgi:dolichyl-phosphate beta-glucosyltransferase
MKSLRLSIIIPAYQEAARIEASLERLADYLQQHHHTDVEVIVVVATSPDGTAKLAQAKAPLFRHFRVVAAGPRVGKGRDVRVGMMEASGDYRLFMDADLATPLKYIEKVYRDMEAGPEVIIAVRNLQSSHAFGLRWMVSSFGNWLLRSLLLPGIKDSQCGFKAFSAAAAEELFGRQKVLGWGFDMEILAIARMLNYSIAQIPVPDWHDKPDGTFENNVMRAAVATLGELLAIIWRRWTGGYRQKSFSYKPWRS